MRSVYKNIGMCARRYYGVDFNPGDTKSVPGAINNPNFVFVGTEEYKTKAADKANRRNQPSQTKSITITKEETVDGTDCNQ